MKRQEGRDIVGSDRFPSLYCYSGSALQPVIVTMGIDLFSVFFHDYNGFPLQPVTVTKYPSWWAMMDALVFFFGLMATVALQSNL
jgi:hypothetical protein